MNRKKVISILSLFLICAVMLSAQSVVPGGSRRVRNHSLEIRTNTEEARIIVMGPWHQKRLFGGQSDNTEFISMGFFQERLTPGRYKIIVEAPGYFTKEMEIDLDSSKSLTIRLTPRMAKVTISIPDRYFLKGREDRRRIRFYDNGALLRGGPVWELTPGRHTITMEAGPLVLSGQFYLEAGEEYHIEPFIGLQIEE